MIAHSRARTSCNDASPAKAARRWFVLGTVPLLIATGAGAELRQALGTAVFFGMLGVTGFGLLFTPTFYVVCRALGTRLSRRRPHGEGGAVLQPAE